MGWTFSEDKPLPQARTAGFLAERVDDEVVLYDLETKHVHCLSPRAALVFERCDGVTTPAQLAAETRLTVDEVLAAATQLQERSLLDRPALVVQDGLSRRGMVRKTAMAGAAALAVPLISSIVAPTAMAADSGIPSGCSGCKKNSDCASNHCCEKADNNANCNRGCCVQGNNSCHINSLGQCTSPLTNCGTLVCPPTAPKCCTPA